jgi:hypothetical protein
MVPVATPFVVPEVSDGLNGLLDMVILPGCTASDYSPAFAQLFSKKIVWL